MKQGSLLKLWMDENVSQQSNENHLQRKNVQLLFESIQGVDYQGLFPFKFRTELWPQMGPDLLITWAVKVCVFDVSSHDIEIIQGHDDEGDVH